MLTPHQLLNVQSDLADLWSSDAFATMLAETWNLGDRFELPTPKTDVAPADAMDLLRHRLIGASSEADLYLADDKYVQTYKLSTARLSKLVIESSSPLSRPGLLLAESDFGPWDSSGDADHLSVGNITTRIKGLLWTPCTRTSGEHALFVVYLSDHYNLADQRERSRPHEHGRGYAGDGPGRLSLRGCRSP